MFHRVPQLLSNWMPVRDVYIYIHFGAYQLAVVGHQLT
jgi:hypothetical protein